MYENKGSNRNNFDNYIEDDIIYNEDYRTLDK